MMDAGMSKSTEIADKAIILMQDHAKHILRICNEKLPFSKGLTAFEVKELREALEFAAEGLDHDSLFCQEELDTTIKEEQLEHDEKVALERIESPLPSPDSDCFLATLTRFRVYGVLKFWMCGCNPILDVYVNLNSGCVVVMVN
jgi:hypothetical protein